MKKIISTLVIAALLVAMIFSFTGCSDASKLEGTWRADIDFTEKLKTSVGTKVSPYFTGTISFPIIITFGSDRSIEISTNLEEIQTSLKTVLTDTMTKYLEATLAGTGMSLEDALKASGTSMDELIEDGLKNSGLDKLADGIKSSGTYDAADGKIYMIGSGETKENADYITYELDGKNLTFIQAYDSSGNESSNSVFPFPWNFVKQ